MHLRDHDQHNSAEQNWHTDRRNKAFNLIAEEAVQKVSRERARVPQWERAGGGTTDGGTDEGRQAVKQIDARATEQHWSASGPAL